jgi:hypothetical protein
MRFEEIYDLFVNGTDAAVKNLMHVLHQRTSLEGFETELGYREETAMTINTILARNTNLRHAKELLALQQPSRRTTNALSPLSMSIGSKSGIWYMAMAKMGRRGNSNNSSNNSSAVAASAIVHIFQTRTAILEKQLQRPARVAQERQPQQVDASRRPEGEKVCNDNARKRVRRL